MTLIREIFKKQPPEVFCKKSALKNFAKFTGKHLCQGLFFNKVAGFRPSTLLKKRLWHVFPCEFCEISQNTFFTEHLALRMDKSNFLLWSIFR